MLTSMGAWGLVVGYWVEEGVQKYRALFEGRHCLNVLLKYSACRKEVWRCTTAHVAGDTHTKTEIP
jgi:hypothetical protein